VLIIIFIFIIFVNYAPGVMGWVCALLGWDLEDRLDETHHFYIVHSFQSGIIDFRLQSLKLFILVV